MNFINELILKLPESIQAPMTLFIYFVIFGLGPFFLFVWLPFWLGVPFSWVEVFFGSVILVWMWMDPGVRILLFIFLYIILKHYFLIFF